jgi:hypothetical protein
VFCWKIEVFGTITSTKYVAALNPWFTNDEAGRVGSTIFPAQATLALIAPRM